MVPKKKKEKNIVEKFVDKYTPLGWVKSDATPAMKKAVDKRKKQKKNGNR